MSNIIRRSDVQAQVQWAQSMADSDLLPAQFKGRPANLMWALRLAESLGLPPMTAITGIHVIQGKPTVSPALMSALVRRAGHKLRVKGNNEMAVAQLIRHDDPDFTYEVIWERRKNANSNPNGEDAGLLGKDNWKNYPAAMLKARAMSQASRDGAQEALLGLQYVPEELGAVVNQDGIPVQVERLDGPPFQDLLCQQIWEATGLDTLKRFHGQAQLAGVLDTVPTGERLTVLQLLNDRAKTIQAKMDKQTQKAEDTVSEQFPEATPEELPVLEEIADTVEGMKEDAYQDPNDPSDDYKH